MAEGLRIVLIGKTGTGKSSTGNSLIGRNVFRSSAIRTSVTNECSVAEAERFGTKLVVVDTPGIFDTTLSEKEFKIQLMECTHLACPGVHAFLFLMKIGDRDINDIDANALRRLQQFLGDDFLSYAIVAFTGKEALDETLEDFIDGLSSECKMFIRSCRGRVVAISNIVGDPARAEAAGQVIDKVKDLVEHNGGMTVYYTNVLFDEKNNQIKERMKRILNANNEIQVQIHQINRELDCLRMLFVDGQPTEEQHKLLRKLETQIGDLKRAIVDRKSARIAANNAIEYERKMRKMKMIVGCALAAAGAAAVIGATAANPTAVVAGVIFVATKLMQR